ncbi:hypothetical protein TNCV_1333321 [Trichonephila clavipes]|nr:hypothetical protein TNCV_1333321 [Trichonephila clavipes]
MYWIPFEGIRVPCWEFESLVARPYYVYYLIKIHIHTNRDADHQTSRARCISLWVPFATQYFGLLCISFYESVNQVDIYQLGVCKTFHTVMGDHTSNDCGKAAGLFPSLLLETTSSSTERRRFWPCDAMQI